MRKNQESFLTTKEKSSLDGFTARSEPIQQTGRRKRRTSKEEFEVLRERVLEADDEGSRARPNLNHTADLRREHVWQEEWPQERINQSIRNTDIITNSTF
jgi:hypothetical protein